MIVLAGGRSSRFGRDKLAEPFRGRPLLHHALVRAAEVCTDVVLVLAAEGGRPSLPDGVAVRVARDAQPDRGPLAGVSAGLREARAGTALVVAGDMPELRAGVLALLLEEAAGRSADAVALRDGDRVGPLPCVLRVEPAASAAERLLREGRRSLRDLLVDLHVEGVDEQVWRALDPGGRTLIDIDEPDDLEP